ncbi:hypothetical protein OPV22_014579 [Ensete ventricosum]|uniref:Uncharacterized protein n=1 Tax=Ensete ventricosum TaxID=4639 RepID=A0AAV8R3K5_ENSVE|nr:hypothetical protein OPV22_014579 [Ensete ventricosum]
MGDNPNPCIEANLAASGRFSGYEIFDLQAVPLPAHMDYASGADGGSSELIAAADAQVLQQYHEPDDSGGHGMEKRSVTLKGSGRALVARGPGDER